MFRVYAVLFLCFCLSVSNATVCQERFVTEIYVEWDVKPYSLTHFFTEHELLPVTAVIPRHYPVNLLTVTPIVVLAVP